MNLRVHGSHKRAIPLSETIEAWILVVSLIFAFWLANSKVIPDMVALMGDYREVVAFIAGLFFTSILTTAPAVVALADLSNYMPMWHVALLGGVGAVIGDVLIFRFVRSHLVERIVNAAFSSGVQRFGRTFAAGPLWWIAPIVGAAVIASPLPDELGLMMLGLSQIRLIQFVPISFVANVTGVFLIALATQQLS